MTSKAVVVINGATWTLASTCSQLVHALAWGGHALPRHSRSQVIGPAERWLLRRFRRMYVQIEWYAPHALLGG